MNLSQRLAAAAQTEEAAHPHNDLIVEMQQEMRSRLPMQFETKEEYAQVRCNQEIVAKFVRAFDDATKQSGRGEAETAFVAVMAEFNSRF